MGFYSINRFSIELKKKQRKPGAQIISNLLEHPEVFVGTTLIGFSVCLVCFVLLFGKVMVSIWTLIGLKNATVQLIADTIFAAIIVLIFAGFIPRAIFRAKSNTLLTHLVWIIEFFYTLLKPISILFIQLSNWVLKYIFNVRLKDNNNALIQNDLKMLVPNNAEEEIQSQELNTELLENVLELSSIKIRECLVPRKEIIGVGTNCTVEQVREKFIKTNLSKLIVYENSIDNIIGYVHQLDLFKYPSSVQSILLPISAVPETMSASDLINKFTKERKSIAWVVDEFGGTAGIVTMEDVLEEIFGEIHDEYDSEEFVEKQLSENEYIFSGRLELDHLSKKYSLSFPEDAESETLSGYIINNHETIPQQKERIIIDNYEFNILSVSNTRIETVKLKILK